MRVAVTKAGMTLAAALLLAACATLQRDAAVSSVVLNPGLTLHFPAPAALGTRIVATQVMTAAYGSRRFSLQLELEWTESEIVVAALGGFGAALFTLRFDGERLETVGNRSVLEGMDVRYVLSDLFLTYLDERRLAQLLIGDHVEISDDVLRRVISHRGEELIRIEYSDPERWNGSVAYHNDERGYSFEIQTIAIERN